MQTNKLTRWCHRRPSGSRCRWGNGSRTGNLGGREFYQHLSATPQQFIYLFLLFLFNTLTPFLPSDLCVRPAPSGSWGWRPWRCRPCTCCPDRRWPPGFQRGRRRRSSPKQTLEGQRPAGKWKVGFDLKTVSVWLLNSPWKLSLIKLLQQKETRAVKPNKVCSTFLEGYWAGVLQNI